MHHESPLIGILVIGLGLAFFFGIIANRLKISPLIGYLLAGIAVGPFTPGFVADQQLALELAEIGVMLLMFGVGLHFSVADLIAVRRVAVPGALIQVLCSVAMGFSAASLLGMSTGAGVVFGLALSVASTVVLLRALQELRLIETERGRLAVGWLVIQDIVTVLALVLLPIVEPVLKPSGGTTLDLSGLALSVVLTIGKVVAFMLLMLVVGRRFIPAFLHYVAQSGSRELFRLSLLALALGVAFIATEWFDVSFALGAFVAGMVLSESELSHHAAEETLPLRDAFAVLFFISVGMLFNPAVLLERPLPLLVTLLVVMVGTPLVVTVILLAFRQSWTTVLFMASGLAQIGEFSFILAALGIQMGVMDEAARDLILGVSILAILANPFVVRLSEWLETRIVDHGDLAGAGLQGAPGESRDFSSWHGHVVIVGFGRVGRFLAQGLHDAGFRFVIIESGEFADAGQAYRDVIISGNAADPDVVKMAGLEGARLLAVAIPEPFEAGQIVEQARRARPDLPIIVRAHFDSAVTHLSELGATTVVMGEREIAHAMLHFAENIPTFPESVPTPAVSSGN